MSERATILVVDDVPQNVRLLEAVLEPRDYAVLTAADGPDALALVESAEPDLVLLDVVMPEMDGYAECREIRAREETAVLPVIMVTSSGGQEKRKAIEAGADDFVQKPFDQHELLTRVRSLASGEYTALPRAHARARGIERCGGYPHPLERDRSGGAC